MAHDAELADRIRGLVAQTPDLTEKRMFGGVAFLVGGNLAVSASGRGGLLARVDPDEADTLTRAPGVRPFELRGRAMRGWLAVDAEQVSTVEALAPWVRRSVAFAQTLPPKRAGT